MMIHLHVHSTYSFLDGYGTPAQIAKRAKELGQNAVALTDHGNICGWIPFHSACRAEGIKPILGVEGYAVESYDQKGYHHIILLAQNLKGYYNIIRLVSKSFTKGLARKPRMLWKDIMKYNEGVIASSACIGGYFSMLWDYGEISRAEAKQKVAKWFGGMMKAYGQRFLVEIMPNKFSYTKDGNPLFSQRTYNDIVSSWAQFKTPLIATIDAHYPAPKDALAQDIVFAVGQKRKMSDPHRYSYSGKHMCLVNDLGMSTLFKRLHGHFIGQKAKLQEFQKAIHTTQKVADSVEEFELPKIGMVDFPTKKGRTIEQEFKFRIRRGIDRRGINIKNKKYKERLKKEVRLILKKEFANYFLIVGDVIRWAKRKGILVGSARGSAAGSLVSYILEITEVNPLKHGLFFERFIDESRTDYPDIDIDIEDRRRGEVIGYMKKKYGEDKIASLATFIYYRGKNSIQDVGRVYDIPDKMIKELSEHVIVRSSADARATETVEDTIAGDANLQEIVKQYPQVRLAGQLEGQIRNSSSHACAVMLADVPIEKHIAVMQDKHGERVLQVDGHGIKIINMLKIDLLNLSTLTTLSLTNKLVKKYHNTTIDYYNLPLDDKKTLDVFTAGDTEGVFQMEGRACTSMCNQLQPTTFEEITHLNAMARPGPIRSGQTAKYFKAVQKGERHIIHKCLKKYTKETQGILLFQEQVMQIVREVGLFSWDEAHDIRKTMSKSMGEEYFNKYKDIFIAGAKKSHGVKKKAAVDIWKHLCTFGAWAFNKSHSVSYSYISYWCAYAKAHYPYCYYAGLAAATDKADKIANAMLKFKHAGGRLLPPSINNPKFTFELVDRKSIMIGLVNVKGIGEKTAKEIIDNAPYENRKDFEARVEKRKVNSRTITILEEIGFFKGKKKIRRKAVKHFPYLKIQGLEFLRDKAEGVFQSLKDFYEAERYDTIMAPCFIVHKNIGDTRKEAGRKAYNISGKYITVYMQDDTSKLVGTSYDQAIVRNCIPLLTSIKTDEVVVVTGKKLKEGLMSIISMKRYKVKE